jgi:two-component system sensor histidine kinase KdpD
MMRRTLWGTAAALGSMAVLTAAMLPVRGSLSTATTALILVIPVVVGVVAGGFASGVISVAVGFGVYDFFFIPPYETMAVGVPQNWVAAGVYVIVMILVARVVAGLNVARTRERRQGRELRELFKLSDLLVEDKPLNVLLPVIVAALAEVFGSRQAAILLPRDGRLEIVSSAGAPLSDRQLADIVPPPGVPSRRQARSREEGGLMVVALTASGRPVGLLALSADAAARHEREPLLLFANQIALAVERAQLREQALRTRVNEEMARLARTLVAAVAHDLRAPLASIKASSSTLSDDQLDIGPDTRHSLVSLIDKQADQLAEMVRSLLDMSRIQAGVLRPRSTVLPPGELISPVVEDLRQRSRSRDLRVTVDDGLPPVDADVTLVSRVLANLVQNALRHGPAGTPVTIRVRARDDGAGGVEVSVTDHGPGVDPARREEIFEMFARRDNDAGAGLGLAIAKTFVEAHGQRIWVTGAPDGGAVFRFTLPAAVPLPGEGPEEPGPEESPFATRSHH